MLRCNVMKQEISLYRLAVITYIEEDPAMTSFQIKIVAIIIMTIDHLASILGQAGLVKHITRCPPF